MRKKQYWTYWLDRGATATEYGLWAGGSAPALGSHFHDDGQLTLVLAGSRKFEVGAEVIKVDAGQCLYIPAGLPHRSLPHTAAGTRCLNIYYLPEHAKRSPALLDIRELSGSAIEVDTTFLLHQIDENLASMQGETPVISPPVWLQEFRDSLQSITDVAISIGLSREAFSRKFTRDFGMSPHAYRVVCRLNVARRQLRDGDAIAATAVDFGFADQSHFGRHFFRVFGITPSAYRNSMR